MNTHVMVSASLISSPSRREPRRSGRGGGHFTGSTSDLGLVGYIGTTEEFMLEQLQESDDFAELMEQAEGPMELTTDGNDSSPHILLDDIHDEWPVDRSKIVELVLSATKSELRDEVPQISFQT